jgi:hypothetical protein
MEAEERRYVVKTHFYCEKKQLKGRLYMYPDAQIYKLIDEMLEKGTTSSMELSDILERNHGISLAPHFITEYKFMEMMKDMS